MLLTIFYCDGIFGCYRGREEEGMWWLLGEGAKESRAKLSKKKAVSGSGHDFSFSGCNGQTND
jgi:hypothetical protein